MSDAPREKPVEVERRGEAIVAYLRVDQPGDRDLALLDESIDWAAAESRATVVVVDMSRVGMLTSLGLGMLVQISIKSRSRGQALKLAGMSSQLRHALRITRLDDVLETVESVEAGVG